MRFHFGLRVVGYRPDEEGPLCGERIESVPGGLYYCGERKMAVRCPAHTGRTAHAGTRRAHASR
ncbi:hypothetical protein [Streptomyces indicus]|uniref:Uncharacterized protein n=1 Tax=Streptomyces indicus TaxID=417292 RepID=A0A1G8ZNU6_9ACTN|nr:hypothetical protein [Streptomyces indicus]SDK16738.1 hypothetical protein SAMN05421806_105103 [Streptomyces indicus]